MVRTFKLLLVVSVMLSPVLSNGQTGIGGTVVHRPNLGCACVPVSDSEAKPAAMSSSRKTAVSLPKLSPEQCRKKGDVATVYSASEVNKRAVILDKPEPEVPPGAASDRASRRIILKAVLCPNGNVGRIGIIIGLSKEMNDSAISAAKKIKFEAATKDGSRVAQYVQLEYSLSKP